MNGTILLVLFLVAAALAVLVAIVTMRASGPRPDAPLKGMAADAPDAGAGSDEESTAKLDRPGGPGQESENPDAGDAVPGSDADKSGG